MNSVTDYIQIIEDELNKSIFNTDRHPQELYDPIKYILSNGGKRIRAVLTLLGCKLFSDDYEAVKPVATGLEVFHNFTLLHDDVMDNAFIRRGNPTVHVKWDINTAILSGDAMVILANQLISQTPSSCIIDVLTCFNQTALEVCEGQQYDMNLEVLMLDDSSNTTESYLNMIKLKTSVLIAASLKIGSIIGGATKFDQDSLYNAGISLGIGFQLQDDLLDSFGNEATFGKKIGGDILAKKKTYLVSKALEIASENQKSRLIELYNSSNIAESELIKEVQNIFIESGVKAKTEELIDTYFNQAFESLNTIQYNHKKAFEILYKLFNEIAKRKF